MTPTYESTEQHIKEIANMYKSAELNIAKQCYEQYVQLVILERPNHEQYGLEKLWESKII